MITLIYLFWVDHVWSIEHMYVFSILICGESMLTLFGSLSIF